MKLRWFASGGATGLVLVAGAGLWWSLQHNQAPDQINSVGGTVMFGQQSDGSDSMSSSASSIPISANSGFPSTTTTGGANSGSGSSANNNGLSVVNSNSGSVNGASTGSSGSSNNGSASGSVPGPSEFGQYESYKTAETAYTGDLAVGDGDEAAGGKWLAVDYKGWLSTGTEFDESYARGKQFCFQLGAHKVIMGWEEGFNGMKVGGKRRIIVPPKVGYGAQAQGSIPANSLLIFDVELHKVVDSNPCPPAN